MGLMHDGRDVSRAGLPLPGAANDIPSASALTLQDVSSAIGSFTSSADRDMYFAGSERQISSLIAAFPVSFKAGAPRAASAISEYAGICWEFGKYLSAAGRPADAMAAVKPALESASIMSQPTAWPLVVRYAGSALDARQFELGAAEMERSISKLVSGCTSEKQREFVAFTVQVALTLAEASVMAGEFKRAEALAGFVDRVSWNPRDIQGVGWRCEARYMLGKAALGQDDFGLAVKHFKDAEKFETEALKKEPSRAPLDDLRGMRYFCEVLQAQAQFRQQPVKLEEWLDTHPIPPDAYSAPVCRLRADGYIGCGKAALAFAELEPCIAELSQLESTSPPEAARVIKAAAMIHELLGERSEAMFLFERAANLFERLELRTEERECRRKYLDVAWDAKVSADELGEAADKLLALAHVEGKPTLDAVFGSLGKARALQGQQVDSILIGEVLLEAFEAARALERPAGPLMVCHMEAAMYLSGAERYDQAAEHARQARACFDRLPEPRDTDTLARLEGLIAEISGMRGDMQGFRVSWRNVIALCKEGDVSGQAPLVSDLLAQQFEIHRDREKEGGGEGTA